MNKPVKRCLYLLMVKHTVSLISTGFVQSVVAAVDILDGLKVTFVSKPMMGLDLNDGHITHMGDYLAKADFRLMAEGLGPLATLNGQGPSTMLYA